MGSCQQPVKSMSTFRNRCRARQLLCTQTQLKETQAGPALKPGVCPHLKPDDGGSNAHSPEGSDREHDQVWFKFEPFLRWHPIFLRLCRNEIVWLRAGIASAQACSTSPSQSTTRLCLQRDPGGLSRLQLRLYWQVERTGYRINKLLPGVERYRDIDQYHRTIVGPSCFRSD